MEKEVFSTNGAENWISLWCVFGGGGLEYHPCLTPFVKIKVYLEIDLNGNAETIKLLEDKNICKLRVGKLLTQDIQKAQREIKSIMWNCSPLKRFLF